ncbi:MAG TPA: chemotaxis protein CheB [Terracidiphilus sp.]|nr:chemotaxis protein CheB [Terracidiphilus sp.]
MGPTSSPWSSPAWAADGCAGSQLIHAHGGTILAQDEATSTVWGMPGAVARAGIAHRILPLPAIAPEIVRIASRRPGEAYRPRETMVS